MIIFLTLVYLLILFLLVHLKIVPFNLFWKLSPLLVLILLNVALFIPMGWGAPSGPALVSRHSVQIAPEVAGPVVEVAVSPNTPLKADDVLFRIDPAPFEAQVNAISAQLELAQTRLGEMTTLAEKQAGRVFDVEQRQSEVDQLTAQLAAAKWNLEKTTVRAPAGGYVTNIALREGARATPQAPVMAFIDSSETILVAEIGQIYARYIKPDQPVEITFKFLPGQIHKGRVEAVLQAISSGQSQPTGLAITPESIKAEPFVVRIKLDDDEIAQRLPVGATGTTAIFTDHMKTTHVIRRVILRQLAFLNYIIPF